MNDFDVVVVGSGMNSLVCAAVAARAGHSVAVVERNSRLGGCIRSEELFDGFTHDIMSSWYPLFITGPAFAELGDDLAARGLEFANTSSPTGVATSGGDSLILSTDMAANVERLDALAAGDGGRFVDNVSEVMERNAAMIFEMLGNEPRSRSVLQRAGRELWARKVTGALEFVGDSLENCRTWLGRDIESEVTRAALAPWVLHAGLGPDDAASGVMGKLIAATVVNAGMPVVVGGSSKIVDAFDTLITDRGGTTLVDSEVSEVLVSGGRARGVRLADGTNLTANKAVVCNVTPQQLYLRLLAKADVPSGIVQRAKDYRYGRGDMQIHYALSERPQWDDPDMADVAVVHLTDGLNGVSRSVNEADCGLLPAEGTVVVGQPCALDPTRAPDGASILWIQLQEVPRHVRGDARGEIDVGDGTWSDDVANRYADRIEDRLRSVIHNFDDAVVGRTVFSPADLETMNPNLVGGDPYSGACTLDQFLYWRPFAGPKGHRTPIDGLFHIGASTHPGPGLGGSSGYLVGTQIS